MIGAGRKFTKAKNGETIYEDIFRKPFARRVT